MFGLSYWPTVLLVALVESTSATTETNSKYECKGYSVNLFSSKTIDTPAELMQLYKFTTTSVLIATRGLSLNITNGYSKKLFLNYNGDVWIHNISSSDEAKYRLVLVTENNVSTFEVTLHVYVAPSMDCKPKIKRIKDILIASVQADDCGKPAASAYWLEYPGINSDGNDVIKLPPQHKAGTYYACIEGPVVKCGKSSRFSEYCSNVTIEDDVSSKPGGESKGPGTERSQLNASFEVLLIGCGLIFVTLMGLFLNICIYFTRIRSIKKDAASEPEPKILQTFVQKEERQLIQRSDCKNSLSLTENAAF